MVFNEKILKEAAEYAVTIRRHLHKHPELSEKEFQTQAMVCEFLDKLDIPNKKIAGTGVVGIINGILPGPVVGLRADMDALPIQERNVGKDYISSVKNVMHACGHDAHTAILMGTAMVLNSVKDQLPGSIKLFFQPAEEGNGGAERMIAAGCMENPHVDAVLGLHVASDLKPGQIGIKYGKMYAASDILTLKIFGKSSHGASPQLGIDAILIAAAILNNIQTVVSRNIAPTDSAVCTFGTIHGGNVRNQIADYVELTGIIRTLDSKTRLSVREKVRNICEQTAEMMGGHAELIIEPSYSPLINNDAIVDIVRETASSLLKPENVILRETPSLGVEDFAYFAGAAPSCFYHLGCATGDEKHDIGHSCYFDIDEACLEIGIRLQCLSACKVLETILN